MENISLSKLSREDELSVRKVYIEKILTECKVQTENKVMLLLAGAFDNQVENKAQGQCVFLERWIKDLEKEIDSFNVK